MKKVLSILAIQLMLGSLLPAHASSAQYRLPNFRPDNALGREVLRLTNEFRTQHNLPLIHWNQRLANLAKGHSVNMGLAKAPFGHTGLANRVRNFPTPPKAYAENIFQSTLVKNVAEITVKSWSKIPAYRKNMLGNFNYCGIGAYQNVQGIWFFTQLFGLL